MNKVFKFVFVVVLCVLVSCKGKQSTVSVSDDSKLSASDQQVGVLYDKIVQNQLDYKTIEIPKFQVKINTGGKSYSSKATLRIYKDSAIWVSVQPLAGIEMFRFLMTKDSVKFINRLQQEYAMRDIVYCQQKWGAPVDLYVLQAMLTDQLFVQGKKNAVKKDYSTFAVLTSDSRPVLSNKNTKKRYVENFYVNNSYKITETKVDDKQSQAVLSCKYDNFIYVKNKLFPMSIGVAMSDVNQSAQINFEYSTVKVDEAIDMTFSVPKKYTRTSLPF